MQQGHGNSSRASPWLILIKNKVKWVSEYWSTSYSTSMSVDSPGLFVFLRIHAHSLLIAWTLEIWPLTQLLPQYIYSCVLAPWSGCQSNTRFGGRNIQVCVQFFATSSAMLSLIHVVVVAFGCFSLYQVYLYFTVGAARRKLVKEHACRPPPAYPHKDPIFGLDLTMKLRGHKQKNILLQESVKRYRIFGNTFSLIGVGIPSKSSCHNLGCRHMPHDLFGRANN